MRQVLFMIGMAAALHTAVVLADDSDTAPVSAKRQMVICMNKSMSANKILSYNDAQRACKERLSARSQSGGIGKHALAANASGALALKTP
jgi:hypothetical protein